MKRSYVSEPQTPEFVQRPWILWAGLLWGFAEATLFFIVPDVLLTLVALFSFRRSVKVLGCILVGALLGGTIMFYLGASRPQTTQAAILHVPFVSQAMFARTQKSFQHDGIWALTKGPGNGIPYKVYAAQSAQYAGLPLFLFASVLARMERFALFWALATLLGAIFRRKILQQPKIAMAVHICIWCLGYAWYWSKI